MQLSIRDRLDDAELLRRRGSYDGALMSVLSAVAGSSRKALPQGVKSTLRPGKPMGDSEAFRLFLGGRLRRLLDGDESSPEFTEGLIHLGFDGTMRSIPALLYKLFRNPLMHEAGLPNGVVFAEGPAPHVTVKSDLHVSTGYYDVRIWQQGGKLGLSFGWLQLLNDCVTTAPVNKDEFGAVPLPPSSSIRVLHRPAAAPEGDA